MKKFIVAALMLGGLFSTAFAQTAAPQKTTTAPRQEIKKAATTTNAVKPTPVAISKPAPAAKTAVAQEKKQVTATKLKADGTPDMRYKENKAAAAATTVKHTKKDGTADMRYKENKKVKGK
jgi:hypothetical protein